MSSVPPPGGPLVGERLVTRFGEVQVQRRRYRDAQGGCRFLLDESLGWEQGRPPTYRPSFEASRLPLRQVSHTVAALRAGVLAPARGHRGVRRVAHKVLAAEQASWQACFAQGEAAPRGERVVEVLSVEADGVWVSLQREASGGTRCAVP